jgi:hypothetical protein
MARQGAPIVGSRSSLIVLFLKHGLQLVPQLRGIFVTMRGNRMLHRCIEHFLFRARDFQCALLLARVIPAIDRFSHDRIPLLFVVHRRALELFAPQRQTQYNRSCFQVASIESGFPFPVNVFFKTNKWVHEDVPHPHPRLTTYMGVRGLPSASRSPSFSAESPAKPRCAHPKPGARSYPPESLPGG